MDSGAVDGTVDGTVGRVQILVRKHEVILAPASQGGWRRAFKTDTQACLSAKGFFTDGQ